METPGTGAYDEIESTDGLRGALMESLDRRSASTAIRAKIRAEVFASLNNEAITPPSAVPGDVYLAGEIIKDFLVRMKCENTLSVFAEELGTGGEAAFERETILQELGIAASPGQDDVPAILLLLSRAKTGKSQMEPS